MTHTKLISPLISWNNIYGHDQLNPISPTGASLLTLTLWYSKMENPATDWSSIGIFRNLRLKPDGLFLAQPAKFPSHIDRGGIVMWGQAIEQRFLGMISLTSFQYLSGEPAISGDVNQKLRQGYSRLDPRNFTWNFMELHGTSLWSAISNRKIIVHSLFFLWNCWVDVFNGLVKVW